MVDVLVWLVKFPFVLVAVILAFALGLVGLILSGVGAFLTPVLGLGWLILPFGLALLFAAWLIVRLL
jgi:hypothetical protein